MKGFENALVYIEGEGIKRSNLYFEDKIEKVGGKIKAEILPLPEGAVVLPGFFDEHIHGAGGADTMDGSFEALQTMSQTLAKEGVTGFLATTMTQSEEHILSALRAVKDYAARQTDGAKLYGVHLEGPFLSPFQLGAQKGDDVKRPSIELFDRFQKESGNLIKIVTIAPEEEGATELISHLADSGVVPSIGHTNAGYGDICSAIAAGAKNLTHTYNAQSKLHHREIGAVGSGLLRDELNCELIADLIHVSDPAIRLLLKCKPKGKITLITDAMRAKGLGDGDSELGGQRVIVKGGEARLANGALAGSVLCMNRAVQNLVKCGASLTEAVDCATITPAKTLGVDKITGSVKEGKRADLTVLDGDFNVLCTVCGGKIVYRAAGTGA